MEKGIMICGLNGSGKSTLGALWLSPWGISSLTMRICSFQKQIPTICLPLRVPVEEAIRLLAEVSRRIRTSFFPPYAGTMGRLIPKLYRCVIRVEVPKEIRLAKSAAPIL